MVLAGAWFSTPSDDPVPTQDSHTMINPETLYQVLLPADGHPAGQVVTKSMQEATEAGWLGLPRGMQMEPQTCFQYLAPALGGDDTTVVNGWMQTGPVRPEDRQEVVFVSWVIEVPKGVDLGAVQQAALSCRGGAVTLVDTVTGEVGNRSAEPIDLPKAETLALQQQVRFAAPADEQEAEVLAQYYGPSPNGVHSTSHLEFVHLGEVLIMVSATNPQLADEAAQAMYYRALEVLG